MDLVALLQSFATPGGATGGAYPVSRRTTSGFQHGIAQPTTNTTINVTGSMQPAKGRDLLLLPEGRRTTESRWFYTTTQLLTGDMGQSFEADLITIDGDNWQVMHVEKWLQSVDGQIMWRCLVQPPTPRTS